MSAPILTHDLPASADRLRLLWRSAYPAGIMYDAQPRTLPVAELLNRAVFRFADHPCLDFMGFRQTYGAVGAIVDRLAAGLQALGVARGVKVGLLLPNCPYFIYFYFAVLKAGGTVVNYNPLYAERELEHQIADSETDIMVTLDLVQIYQRLAVILPQSRLKQVIICPMTGILPWAKGLGFRLLKGRERAHIPDDHRHMMFDQVLALSIHPLIPADIDPATDIAVLQYTGGTTGVPKGAMLTHANVSANAFQCRAWLTDAREGEERMLAVLPFFHVFAMTAVLNLSVCLGAEMLLLPRFELRQLLRTITERRATLLQGVPTIYTAITHSPDLEHYDLSSIRYCISGGAPLPVEIKARFEALTGCQLAEGYGLTEASPVVVVNPLDGRARAGAIGLPLPGTEVEIRDPADPGRVMPLGEKGEVFVRGPQVMAGYWLRPDETATVMDRGWLHTGDIGFIDTDGFVHLVDRIKDVILAGGYNVYPRLVEEAIHQHPAVAEVVVIGIPDEYRGETAKAFVVLRPGHQLSAEDLKHFLRDKLSPIEQPKFVEFRTSLPKTMIGKLSRKDLVAEEAARRNLPAAGRMD